jgi:ankyrin repeat protein
MDIIVNEEKKTSNPSYLDVKTALLPITNRKDFEVLFKKSEYDWLRAIWKPAVGIKIEHKDPSNGGEIFEDKQLFISQKKTISLFQAYAADQNGWKNMIEWNNKNNFSLKSTLLKFIRPVQFILSILSVALFILLLLTIADPDQFEVIDEFLDSNPTSYGVFFSLIGLLGISKSYTHFFYRYEIENDPNGTPGHFVYSLFCLFIGVVIFIVNW